MSINMTIRMPNCDSCDKPATHMARDFVDTTPDNGTIYESKALDLKCGCDEHPVESRRYDKNFNLIS